VAIAATAMAAGVSRKRHERMIEASPRNLTGR
jgi:hypothetical protein